MCGVRGKEGGSLEKNINTMAYMNVGCGRKGKGEEKKTLLLAFVVSLSQISFFPLPKSNLLFAGIYKTKAPGFMEFIKIMRVLEVSKHFRSCKRGLRLLREVDKVF